MQRKIDWLNHLLEFIVVVIGILLAFQLNKCSNDKKQTKTIQTHLEQIYEETETNKKSLTHSVSMAEDNISKLDSIFQFLASGGNYEHINRLSIELLNLGGAYIKKNAYSSLVQTGDIRFMEDFDDKQRIIDLYEYYKWVEGFEKMLANDFNNDYYPYIKEHFDIVGGRVQDPKIYTSKKFRNLLGAYRYFLRSKLEKYKECLKVMDVFLDDMA